MKVYTDRKIVVSMKSYPGKTTHTIRVVEFDNRTISTETITNTTHDGLIVALWFQSRTFNVEPGRFYWEDGEQVQQTTPKPPQDHNQE